MGFDLGSVPGGTSNAMAFQALVKPFIGAGALNLPFMSSFGLVQFSILLVLLTYIASYCIFRLVDCSEIIMHAESRLVMLKRKIGELNRSLTTSIKSRHPTPSKPSSSDSFSSPNLYESTLEPDELQLFDQIPQFDDSFITDHDRAQVTLPSFTEIGAVAYGPFGAALVDFCIIITQLGSCCAYVIFISKTLFELTGLSQQVWSALLVLPLVMLSFVRDMTALAPLASLGNLVYLYAIIVLVYQGMNNCCVPVEEIELFNLSTLPIMFGSLSFALEGIVLVLPVKQRMSDPNSFNTIMSYAMLTIFAVYFLLGNIGAIFHGQETKSPITSNLVPGFLADTVKICLCLALFFTYAIQIFPAVIFFDRLVDRFWFHFDFIQLRQDAVEDEISTLLGATTPRASYASIRSRSNSLASSLSSSQNISFQHNQHQHQNQNASLDTKSVHSKPVDAQSTSTTITIPSSSPFPSPSSDLPHSTLQMTPLDAPLDVLQTVHITSNNPQLFVHVSRKRDNFSTTTPASTSDSVLNNPPCTNQPQNNSRTIFTNEDLVPQDQRYRRILFQNIHRTLSVLLTIFVAMLFPEFSLVVALFGAFTNALLAYILPAAFYLRIVASKHFYGIDWFPHDRTGAPTQLFPHHNVRSLKKNTPNAMGFVYNTGPLSDESDTEPNTSTSINTARTNDLMLSNSKESRPLLSQPKKSTSYSCHHNRPDDPIVLPTPRFSLDLKKKIAIIAFPVTVVILGTLSSAIGVSVALKDLLNNP